MTGVFVRVPGRCARSPFSASSASPAVRLFAVLCAMLAGGCAWNTPPATTHQPMTARPAPRQDLIVNAGSIYQPDAGRLVLYEDRRSRFVGDTIVIVIEENTTASKKSSGAATRTGETELNVPTVSGVPFKTFQGMNIEASSDQSFEGKGNASSDNAFRGNLAVTVTEVLENGNLLVSGEKQVTINQGTEYIRFSGVINPVYVQANNTVSSTRVADARVEYRGTGYVSEAQTMGWLSRFFMSVWPF